MAAAGATAWGIISLGQGGHLDAGDVVQADPNLAAATNLSSAQLPQATGSIAVI